MPSRHRALVVATIAALSVSAPVRAAEPALPPFYESVAKMAAQGKLGQVIAQEPVATAIPHAKAWRMAYISSDLHDRPTISTGLVIAPEGPPPPEGRPIVAWAHGTTGTAENCGPSQEWDPAQPLNEYFLIGGTSSTDFGVPAADAFIAKGYVLVATDYQGLGGGGRHQYSISATQARDAIDAIRAAGSLGLAGAGRKAAVYGWSQGGGTTLAAASLPGYIGRTGTAFDGIDIVGFAAMAPHDVAALSPQGPIDDATAAKTMESLTASFSDTLFNFAHFSMNMWAMTAAFPDLKLTDLFTDDGAKALDAIYSRKCVHAAADTMNFAYGATYKSLLRPEPANASAWVRDMIEGSVQPVAPVAPVVIYWGAKDTVVPPVMGKLYREQMCRLGGNVARVQLPGDPNHFTTPPVAEPFYVAWIEDRLAGKPAPNGCAVD
jgi:pimeloyl-ACP methyl ester carboxylesterase